MDIEQVTRFFSVQHFYIQSLWIQTPAIAAHSLNILRSLNKGLSTMTQGAGPGSAYYPYWIAWLMAALFIQCRRPWSPSRTERLVVGTAAAAWGAHSFLTISSQTHAYALFFFPWWIWQSGFVLQRIFQRTLDLDGIDAAILGLCVAIFAFPSQQAAKDILLACLFLLTLIPRSAISIPRWLIPLYAIVTSCVILGTDHCRIPARLHQAMTQNRFIQREVLALRGENRIIGPMTLWLYNSNLNLQSLDFEFLGIRLDPTPWIVAYRPTLILWPRSRSAELNALLVARYPALSLSAESAWTFPATYAKDFLGLRLRHIK